jgi:fimbrial chaperone protein
MKLKTFCILFFLLFSANSFAFKFSPMSASIGIKTGENSSQFYLENDAPQSIAVQVSIAKREMDKNGSEINDKIGNELSVYPSQLIIPANEKRSVKVFWSGSTAPTKEMSYRLIAEQLPIELEKSKNKKSSIKILLRYIAALYVNAEDYNSSVAIKELRMDGKKIYVELVNSGKKHQVLANLNLKFTDEKSNKETLLKPEDLKGMTGENILADSSRIFTFPKDGKWTGIHTSDKVKISFDKD